MAVEMHAGLDSKGGSELKMLLTYVDKLPNGHPSPLCSRMYSPNFLGLLNFFYACFRRGRIVTFMLGGLNSLLAVEQNPSIPLEEARLVLGDITNQLGKRGSNLISSSPKSSCKSVIGSKRTTDPNNSDDDDSRFWKQVSKAQSGVPNPAHDAKEPPSGSGVDTLDLGKCRALPNVVALGDTIKESIPSVTVAESSKVSQRNDLKGVKDCGGEETVVVSDSGENDCTQESLATKVMTNETKTLDLDYLPSSQSESIVNSRLVELLDKGPYGLDRCKLLKGDISSSSAIGLDLLKSCSCSFCAKAAYIWSDLHYQDVKGRISVLGKSQKEANNLAQRYSGENEKLRHGQQHSKKGLENDLTSQWNSLLQHMGEMFASECSQLQSYLLTLKDLREGFRNSGSICGSSDGQRCSSEGSDP
ncbi:hypothetical protein Cgig2_000436 [Carnegiea gigantea]|uniref:DNA-directed RNA polymerase n=1 Tax=Carnegiea gigantea TaxID=171969 RepID=A0A9Q1JIV6_9CARY|nr:hypothetical protein Cgig2_000436 [Carnegiea gigantea]